MKPNLLVTLATADYIDQAKQLFSSVYFNAGWKGDYMLLAYEIPEEKLVWFRERGIGVKHCKQLHNSLSSNIQYNDIDSEKDISVEQKRFVTRFRNLPVVFSKFELFTTEFKKWNTVVFLDADIIVRYSLDKLLNLKGFYAVPDLDNLSLKDQFFVHRSKPLGYLYEQLKTNFNLNTPAFNSGVMAFSTDMIEEDSFQRLLDIFLQYYNSSTYGEQPILNLFLYKKWKKLHPIYNVFANSLVQRFHISTKKIDGITLHILSEDKPWLPSNPFYTEWKKNLEKAEFINLKERPKTSYFFGTSKKIHYFLFIECRKVLYEVYYFLDRQIGRIGIFLRKL